MRALPFLMSAAMLVVPTKWLSIPASPSLSTIRTTNEIEQTCDLVGANVRKLCIGFRLWQFKHSSS